MTSLEPCQLCAGAVRMATVGALTFVGADPLNGSAWVLASDRYVERYPVKICGPRTDQIGRLASGLHVAFYLRRPPRVRLSPHIGRCDQTSLLQARR